ncbi:MAG: hypothetical protein ABJN40_16360 [Sneathiella sp.]
MSLFDLRESGILMTFKTRNSSSRCTKALSSIFVVGLVSILLGGCISTSEPPPPLSKMTSKNFTEVVKEKPLVGAGAIAVFVLGAENYPLIYSIDGIPAATQHQGFIWLPVVPGLHKFHARQASFNFSPIQVSVTEGKVTYLVFDSSWFAVNPYRIGSKQEFEENLKKRPTMQYQVALENPVHAFLPTSLKVLLDGCGPSTIQTMCKRALEEIPEILIGSNRRAQIAALTKAGTDTPLVATLAAAEEKIVPLKTTEIDTNLELSAEIQRDQLMVQISDLLQDGKAAEALGYFLKLDALPVPIDTATDFYWAQAMLANGDKKSALVKLTRFIKRIETSSQYYQPAIRLLTTIKG